MEPDVSINVMITALACGVTVSFHVLYRRSSGEMPPMPPEPLMDQQCFHLFQIDFGFGDVCAWLIARLARAALLSVGGSLPSTSPTWLPPSPWPTCLLSPRLYMKRYSSRLRIGTQTMP